MPWHLSVSDPRKVYDSWHEVVCVCQDRAQAALIVDSVNSTMRKEGAELLQSRAAASERTKVEAPVKPDLAKLAAENPKSGANDAGFAVACRRW